MKRIILLITTLTFFSSSYHVNYDPEIKSSDIIEHIKYLSSDELAGRFPGTPGDSLSQDYIIYNLKKYGVMPGGDDGYRQRFSYIASIKAEGENRLVINGEELKTGKDWVPVYLTSSGVRTSGEIVFAGYGINAPELNYNDYEGIDVSGKIVMVFLFTPTYGDPHNNSFAKYERLRVKCEEASRRGAAGVIALKGPLHGDDELLPLRMFGQGENFGINVANIRREFAEKYFRSAGKDIKSIQEEINSTITPRSFSLGARTDDFITTLNYNSAITSNVIGFIEGSDPVLKKEYVVIGAHLDHLGDGLSYGSLHSSGIPEIHNGADDNASGCAGLLELAEYFSARRESLKRSIMFMWFGAEEAGLIGSAYFVKSPLLSNYNIVTMINLDMIGRLNNSKLTIGGTGTSEIWERLLDSLNIIYGFKTSYSKDGFGPSDHASFYAKDIPVLFFFTGLHEDYHKPSDDWHLINSSGAEQITKLVADVAKYIATADQKPPFVKVQSTSQNTNRSFRVSLGVIPDYSSSKAGLEITGVKSGSVAEKSGLLAGDLIVKMGDYDIKNIYDYTDALSRFKPGDETEIVVNRGDEVIKLKVKFP